MTPGIEAIDLYAGRLSLDLQALAAVRGMDPDYLEGQIMADARTVMPPYEDAVTLAVNAARLVLTPGDRDRIALLIVATESAVDFGKPVSTWVHRHLELPARCRNFEIKHACYSGTAALQMAAGWLAASGRSGAKALVIAADHSREHLGDEIEFICGGAAVAMVVGPDAAPVLTLAPGRAGYWTQEIADTFRPSPTAEVGDNQASLFSYLDALDASYEAYEDATEPGDPRERFARQVYHAPFPGMALTAHRALMRRFDVPKKEILADFRARVERGLWIARRIGGAYGASIFVNLIALLAEEGELKAGDRLGAFSYGSGCQGEFFELGVGEGAAAWASGNTLRERLNDRVPLSVGAYEAFERTHAARTMVADVDPRALDPDDWYTRAYAGRELLVLESVRDHRRQYAWS